jgi:hypothetical protein
VNDEPEFAGDPCQHFSTVIHSVPGIYLHNLLRTFRVWILLSEASFHSTAIFYARCNSINSQSCYHLLVASAAITAP